MSLLVPKQMRFEIRLRRIREAESFLELFFLNLLVVILEEHFFWRRNSDNKAFQLRMGTGALWSSHKGSESIRMRVSWQKLITRRKKKIFETRWMDQIDSAFENLALKTSCLSIVLKCHRLSALTWWRGRKVYLAKRWVAEKSWDNFLLASLIKPKFSLSAFKVNCKKQREEVTWCLLSSLYL